VTLIEGMIASLVMLVGMVGVLQGILFASQQNTRAQRQLRATLIANETLTSMRNVGFSRLTATGGLLGNTSWCQASPSTAFQPYTLGFHAAVPAGVTGSYSVCTVDLDTVAAGNATIKALTPSYVSTAALGEDDDLFTRAVVFYKNTAPAADANSAINYVTVVVSWRSLGELKSVTQTTALYDTTRNQTNAEL
jgi:Tfp pilus assembly protein PilV